MAPLTKPLHCPLNGRCHQLGVCQAKCRDSRPTPPPAPREVKR